MMLVIAALGVVIARIYKKFADFLSVFPFDIVRADSDFGVFVRVKFADIACEHFCDLKTVFRSVSVVYLVADAPHYNAGVIAVTLYPAFNIGVSGLLEETCVVKLGLGQLPHIEAFAVHEQTYPVANFKQLPCRHIMRGSDSVRTHFFHYQKLTFNCTAVHSSTERTEIVMKTNAFELHIFSVEEETLVGVKFYAAEAEVRFIRIKYLTVPDKVCTECVNNGRIELPKLEILNGKISAFRFGGNVSVRIINSIYNAVIFADSFGVNVNRTVFGIGCNINAVPKDMCFIRFVEINAAVNSCTRIPSRIRRNIADLNHYGVFAVNEQVGDIERE